MPLDPVLKSFLDQMAARPGPRMWGQAAPEGRPAFLRVLPLAGPKGVPTGRPEKPPVPSAGGDIPIRLYSPVAAGSDALPVLIYYHGGGFVIGDLETHDGLCRMLANEAGCRVAAVHYRLAPEHKFPAAVD